MKMWWTAFLLMSMQCIHAEYPALQTALTQKGLQKVTHWLTDWLQDKMGSIILPEVRGSVDIYIGQVDYDLYNMHIERCDLPEPSVSFSEGTGILLKVSGLSLAITGSWKTHFGLINDGGWFSLAVYYINLNTVLQLESDEGHLYISNVICSADVGDIQIKFHGGGSFIFQPFVKRFKGYIANEIREKICPTFKKAVEDLDTKLAKSDALKIDPYVYMNISLTDSPVVTDDAFELHMKGEFDSTQFPSEPPFPPKHFELSWQAKYMLSLGVSEFCVNSAAYAYLNAGVLKVNIKEDMIPKFSPLHLNTSQFGFLIPQLPKMYPNMTMEVLLYATDTPLFSFTETMIKVHLTAAAKVFALGKDSVAIPLFRLDVNCCFSGKSYIDHQLLKGVLEMKNLTISLGSTQIGKFPIAPIQNMVTLALSKFVLPKVNAQLQDGLPLPSVKGFSLLNSVLVIDNGFFMIATDIAGPYDVLH